METKGADTEGKEVAVGSINKTLDEVLLKRGRTSPTQLQVHLSSRSSSPIRACEER